MLNEENVKIVPFEKSVYIAFFISNFIISSIFLVVILAIMAFFNSIHLFFFFFLLFILLFIVGWYTREYFIRFIYELRNSYFFSRKGVITPSYTIIPYKNIQDIHLDQSIYEKIFGLWAVEIYTATTSRRGSDRIFGLNRKNAEYLRLKILKKMREVKKID